MKRNFEDPELKVTRFDYERIMDIDIDDGGIPDTSFEDNNTWED